MYQQYTPTHATPVRKEADQLAEPRDLITISKPDQAELANSVFFSLCTGQLIPHPSHHTKKNLKLLFLPFTRTDEHLDTTHLHQNTKNSLA